MVSLTHLLSLLSDNKELNADQLPMEVRCATDDMFGLRSVSGDSVSNQRDHLNPRSGSATQQHLHVSYIL